MVLQIWACLILRGVLVREDLGKELVLITCGVSADDALVPSLPTTVGLVLLEDKDGTVFVFHTAI